MSKNEPMRIAHIIGKWVGGGVEAVVMNYYRNIDREKIQFDFICDDDSTNILYEEIEKLGGRVILIPPYQKVFKYHKELKKIFKENNYKIVHSHINTLSVFPLFAAWMARVPVRIAHNHATSNKKEFKRNIIKNILRPFSKVFSNKYMSCSKDAGIYLFGNKSFKNGKVHILKNAIDLNKFKFDEKNRKKIRKEFNIEEDMYIIGHIGRFVETKNQEFVLNLFYNFQKKHNNSKLFFVGEGPMKNRIIDKTKELAIEDSVVFLGQRNDVEKILHSMDLFLLPSLYEGLGMVLIEAQASNLDIIASTNVPEEARVNENFKFESLSEEKKWLNEVTEYYLNYKKNNRTTNNKPIQQEYDIKKESKKLEKLYIDLLTKQGERN